MAVHWAVMADSDSSISDIEDLTDRDVGDRDLGPKVAALSLAPDVTAQQPCRSSNTASQDSQPTLHTSPDHVERHPTKQDEGEELPPVIGLNVGGHRFMTRQSTLCKYGDSMLAAMFSGRHKLDRDSRGYYFIDSNGAYFSFILDYLRHETLPPDSIAVPVYQEAVYYNIGPLQERLQLMPSVARMLVRDAYRQQFPDYKDVKQRVIHIAMHNASVDRVGEVLIYAYRKEFVPKAAYFNTKHECVVDAAHVTVGPWDSPADEEALIRCLENDFMQEGFSVKPHEQKRRCKYYNGQNCQKAVYKLTFLFN